MMMFDISLRMIFVRKLIFTDPECWIIINTGMLLLYIQKTVNTIFKLKGKFKKELYILA